MAEIKTTLTNPYDGYLCKASDIKINEDDDTTVTTLADYIKNGGSMVTYKYDSSTRTLSIFSNTTIVTE